MAGAGWRQFTVGQLLTSAQVQTFLQDQAVQVFASAAARTSALGTAVSEGMVSYRTDGKALELYANSVWSPVMQGRNAVINGGFDIWQRGTSFTGYVYTADRWQTGWDITPTSATWSQQTFTPGSAPAAGNEAQFFLRMTTATVGSNTNITISNKVEDVRTLAGQTVTLSFWAKSDSSRTMIAYLGQTFGSGGSSAVFASPINTTVGSTWTRYSGTVNLGSMSGKTIGAGSFLEVQIRLNTANGASLDIWGVQLEAGSVATPFVRAGGTLQGELAACQRYYQRIVSGANFGWMRTSGNALSTSAMYGETPAIVTMRTPPHSIDYSGNLRLINGQETSIVNLTSMSLNPSGADCFATTLNVTSGLTAGVAYKLQSNSSSTAFIGFSAEL
jgi:hypothetical protein